MSKIYPSGEQLEAALKTHGVDENTSHTETTSNGLYAAGIWAQNARTSILAIKGPLSLEIEGIIAQFERLSRTCFDLGLTYDTEAQELLTNDTQELAFDNPLKEKGEDEKW